MSIEGAVEKITRNLLSLLVTEGKFNFQGLIPFLYE